MTLNSSIVISIDPYTAQVTAGHRPYVPNIDRVEMSKLFQLLCTPVFPSKPALIPSQVQAAAVKDRQAISLKSDNVEQMRIRPAQLS